MIVRIQQLALEDAERSCGWPDQGLAGPILVPWPVDASAFEVVVADVDEHGHTVSQRLRRDHLRSIIPSLVEALRAPGFTVITRLDGSLADGGILASLAHLPDPQSRGRFVVSHIQKLDPEPALVIASMRVELDFEGLETLCADPGLDLNFAVRLRAFAVSDELAGPLLDTAEMDDERWPLLMSSMAFAVQPAAGMDAIQVMTSRYSAAEFAARVNATLAGG